jgi:hypothetical protein
MRQILAIFLLIAIFCYNISAQENIEEDSFTFVMDIDYLVKLHKVQAIGNFEFEMLELYDYIAGPRHGVAPVPSGQWIIYKEILKKYSSEIIENEYFETNSIVSKVYLYWILRERNWVNLEYIYIDLLKYKDIQISFGLGGCIFTMDRIENIIDHEYQEYFVTVEGIILPEINLDIFYERLSSLLD